MKLRYKILALATCAAMMLSGAACTNSTAKPAETPETPAEGSVAPVKGITAENFPRVDGSTANNPLIAHLYAKICDVPLENAKNLISTSGTSGAWEKLYYGETDMLIVYEASTSTKGILDLTAMDIKPLGKDALVFLVNSKNPIDSLTSQQLIDIYTGKITDWGQIDPSYPGPISPFQRNESSGSQTMFLKLLMKDVVPMKPATEMVSGFMGSLIDSVAKYSGEGGAIGYSVYYYANEMNNNPDLKLLKVDGVAPTSETIADGSYPLINDFFVVISTDAPADSPQRQLRDWLLTEAGDALLKDAGYVAAPRS